ncbi:hypothetical protein B0H14DRAFT_3535862 [Mycena olivaceomarginata]|nr:hypothetical protein B0H14DRAFT_3535862 [Mycena olivaceomarginata]
MPPRPSVEDIGEEDDYRGAPPLLFSNHILQLSSEPDLAVLSPSYIYVRPPYSERTAVPSPDLSLATHIILSIVDHISHLSSLLNAVCLSLLPWALMPTQGCVGPPPPRGTTPAQHLPLRPSARGANISNP